MCANSGIIPVPDSQESAHHVPPLSDEQSGPMIIVRTRVDVSSQAHTSTYVQLFSYLSKHLSSSIYLSFRSVYSSGSLPAYLPISFLQRLNSSPILSNSCLAYSAFLAFKSALLLATSRNSATMKSPSIFTELANF